MTIGRRLLVCAAVVVGVGGGCWSMRLTWLPAAARWLDVGEVPRRVDCVMALPGDEEYRPFRAAALIQERLADKALIVQNEPSPEELDGAELPTSEIIRRVYQYCRVPESQLVVLAGTSVSTAGDIGVLADFLQRHPSATVAVVTSDYHTRRTRWTLRQQLGPMAARLTVISAPNGDFAFDHWWLSEDGFLLVVMEYIKLAAYLIVYGRLVWWLAAGMATMALWRIRSTVAARARSCFGRVEPATRLGDAGRNVAR